MLDVAISGAGPAGIAAAVALRRLAPSLKVAVYDRARFPRDKPCGGGLTGHAEAAMRELGLALTVPSVAAPHARVTFGAFARQVSLERPVRVVRRTEFDASLVAQARDLGVEVHEGTPVRGFTPDGEGVEVGVGERRIRARVLVAADGVGSLVRKQLLGERSAEAPDNPRSRPIRLFRLEIPARGAWTGDTMLYDFTAMSEGLRGYVWIFPMPGDRLNVGLMHHPSTPLGGAELTALLRRRLLAFGVRLDEPARGWPAWSYHPAGRVAAPHVLLTGDAAGIDALTGEGIAVGLEEGPLVARTVADAFARGDFRFRRHRRDLRRATVGRELALDRWLAWLLYEGDAWRRWLSLVLYDDKMLELYAARVCGSLVLADHKARLWGALVGHTFRGGERRRRLREALEEVGLSEEMGESGNAAG